MRSAEVIPRPLNYMLFEKSEILSFAHWLFSFLFFPLFSLYKITVSGVLRGYDQVVNLVLDETREYLRGK